MAHDKLTNKQRDFIAAYLEDTNATAAYRKAYDAKAMSDGAIAVEAHRLLNNPKVALRIKELQERAAKRVVLTREFILERLMHNATEAAALKDFTASNKALELLGKVDDMGLFVERSNVTSDNRHTVEQEDLSSFVQHLAGVAKAFDEVEAQTTLPN